MKKEIYIVIGETGEYGDVHEWNVCTYTEKEEAEQHVLKANQFLKSKNMHFSSKEKSREKAYYGEEAIKNPWDPEASYDYTGADYSIQTINLLSSIVEFD